MLDLIKSNERIIELYRRWGLSAKELQSYYADLGDAKPLSAISRLRSGKAKPSIKDLLILAKETGTNIDYALSRTDCNEPDDTYEVRPNIDQLFSNVSLTLEEFEVITGLDRATISRIKRGKTSIEKMHVSTLLALSDTFGVSCDYILGLSSKNNWDKIGPDPFPPVPAGIPGYFYKDPDTQGYFLTYMDGENILFPDGSIHPKTDPIFQDAAITYLHVNPRKARGKK